MYDFAVSFVTRQVSVSFVTLRYGSPMNCQKGRYWQCSVSDKSLKGFYDPASVIRFGEILPLWQNFNCLWKSFEGSLSNWQTLNLYWEIFLLLAKCSFQ